MVEVEAFSTRKRSKLPAGKWEIGDESTPWIQHEDTVVMARWFEAGNQ
jgi:hypothetical protein